MDRYNFQGLEPFQIAQSLICKIPGDCQHVQLLHVGQVSQGIVGQVGTVNSEPLDIGQVF